MADSANPSPTKPLQGIKVIEVGQLLAGPFAGTLLAYFGAEVIKVEPPGDGDPIRGWRLLDNQGTSYWWRSLGRNKKSLTLNLRDQQGRALLGKLLDDADVLIENFKPGTMEKWGLGPEEVKQTNPTLSTPVFLVTARPGHIVTSPAMPRSPKPIRGFGTSTASRAMCQRVRT